MSQMSLERDINAIVYTLQFAALHMRNEECYTMEARHWHSAHLATAVHPGHSCEIMPVTGSAIIPSLALCQPA